jgi:NADH:ubiquinone oxidoreductase subunit 6 (subunit J)
MEPIINPWFFYLVNLLDRVLIVTTIVLIISVIGVVFTLFVLSDNLFDEEEAKTCKKWNKISMIALLISTFMLVATPSKETVYEMVVASYITENNIEAAKDNAKDLVDYIIDKCDEANDKDD